MPPSIGRPTRAAASSVVALVTTMPPKPMIESISPVLPSCRRSMTRFLSSAGLLPRRLFDQMREVGGAESRCQC
jgi:hypothetical protein